MRLPEGLKRDYLTQYLLEVLYPSVPVLSYDAIAADRHGRERARLERIGRTPAFADGMVAAIAASEGLILFTRNTKHYEHFGELAVENGSHLEEAVDKFGI